MVVALQERLDRLGQEPRQTRVERILAIGREYASHLSEDERSLDHDKILYNEHGLPRDC